MLTDNSTFRKTWRYYGKLGIAKQDNLSGYLQMLQGKKGIVNTQSQKNEKEIIKLQGN